MREHALWEGLSGSGSSKGSGKSEGFTDRQVGSDNVKWGSGDLFFFVDDTSSLIENGIYSSHSVSWASNFAHEDRFLESWLGG